MRAFLGLDLASTSGFAVLADRGRDQPPFVETSTFLSRGRDFHEACGALSDHLVDRLRDLRSRHIEIVRCGIEDVLRQPPMKKVRVDDGLFAARYETVGASNAISLVQQPALVGAACAILKQFRIPVTLVPAAAWRAQFLGVGRAPKSVPRAKARAWLKSEAVQRAAALGLRWGFKVAGHDSSDAFGVSAFIASQDGFHITGAGRVGRAA